jgi:hypothetical protein
MASLTDVQIEALRFVFDFGDGIDFGGRGVSTSKRQSVQLLIDGGFLGGSVRHSWLTDLGRSALSNIKLATSYVSNGER